VPRCAVLTRALICLQLLPALSGRENALEQCVLLIRRAFLCAGGVVDSCRRCGGVQSGVVQQPRRPRVHFARPPNHRVRRLRLGSWNSAACAALPRKEYCQQTQGVDVKRHVHSATLAAGRSTTYNPSNSMVTKCQPLMGGDAPPAAGTCRQRKGRTTSVARRRCRTSRRMSSPVTGGSPCCPSVWSGSFRSVGNWSAQILGPSRRLKPLPAHS
jgi:hypothetical protein